MTLSDLIASDTERLDFMIAYSARIAHARDGDCCNVWIESDECGEHDRPAEGYPQKSYDTAREAIDAAMKFLRWKQC